MLKSYIISKVKANFGSRVYDELAVIANQEGLTTEEARAQIATLLGEQNVGYWHFVEQAIYFQREMDSLRKNNFN